MNKNIKIENLSDEIKKTLEVYSEDVQKGVNEKLPQIGKDTVKVLKSTSPVKTGQYAKGWRSQVETERLSTKVTVYNKTDYQLTHLLEKGHALVNGGRTSAQPHIKPAQDKAEKQAMEIIEEVIKNA